MTYTLPRNRTDQAAYNLQLQRQYESSRRAPLPTPAGPQPDRVDHQRELRELRDAGVLTDDEYDAASKRFADRRRDRAVTRTPCVLP